MSDSTTLSTTEALGAVLDEHLRWIGQWQRAVFYRDGRGGERSSAPASFQAWCQAASRDDLLQQPAVQKLANLHEQMHRQARLILLKASSGELPTESEYEGVIGRFEEFMLHLRRMERAFAAAASGLDPLTGLRTRRGMGEALEREHNRYRRTGQPFCVALCDIDKFKGINDSYGHDIGDRVLAATAAVISRGVRSFDEAFRMGGEEFLVCLKETGLDEGYAVIERLRVDLMRSPVVLPDGRVIPVTASFGLVEAVADLTVDDLVVCADRALYQAKNSGRNRVIRYGIDRPEQKAAVGRGLGTNRSSRSAPLAPAPQAR